MRNYVRYDELKVGDVVYFHGAKVDIVDVRVEGVVKDGEAYAGEKIIRFDIAPHDEDAVIILGKFYSHGTYGGVGCLELRYA